MLTNGTRLGPHEIVGSLGAGGMGEVYRAVDTRLNRQVAIKVLPEAYASDPERIARFHREAQAVAALNHTAIAGIYELAQAEEAHYLVLELIEGDTLADRLRRGPVPPDDALQIGRQILEALEAAHEKGICHRDLKPANIKITPDGVVKVLDFGLAKFLQTASATPANLTHSPTLSLAGTLPGMILGTAAYMSPEQAKGFEADQRSDIFSFGCILYELLTGRQAFEGDTASEILASVLKSDVDWTRLPPRLNPRLIELLRRCLEKNPKKRWHAAADVRVEIEAILAAGIFEAPPPQAVVVAARPVWQRAAAIIVTLLMGAAAGAIAVWQLTPPPAGTVGRFVVPLPENHSFSNTARRFVDISPDGKRIAYVANNALFLRELSSLDARVVVPADPGGGLTNPAFSPDGQAIAYGITRGGSAQLKQVAVSGGASVTIGDVRQPPAGVSWESNGVILVGQGSEGIVRVSATGGTPERIVSAGTDEMLANPRLLPGGQVVLFAAKSSAANWDRAQIVAQPLDGGERKLLVTGGADPRYLGSGHLIYNLSGVLLAVRFDPDRLAVVGGPVPIVEGVRRGLTSGSSGSSQMGISAAGTLVYAPGAINNDAVGTDLAIFDRKGANQPLKLPVNTYRAPRVSRDGKFVAVEVATDKDNSIWVYELAGTSALRRLTFGGNNIAPTWSPDGQWLAFLSDRDGDLAIFRQRADGSGTAERLTKPEAGTEHIPQDWSRDGAHLLVTLRKGPESTLATLSLRDRTLQPFGDARSSALINAVFSPDGRWIAYQQRDGAANQVFVAPFPATGAKYLLPRNGGHPTWTAKNELVLNTAPQQSMIIRVNTAPVFNFGQPADFPRAARNEPNPATERRAIDFLPDGERLVGVLVAGQAGGAENELIVVMNWIEELKARVPVP